MQTHAWLQKLDRLPASCRGTAIGLVADMVRWERVLDPLEIVEPLHSAALPQIFRRNRLLVRAVQI